MTNSLSEGFEWDLGNKGFVNPIVPVVDFVSDRASTSTVRLLKLPTPPGFPVEKQFSLVAGDGKKRYYTLRLRPSTREDCWYLDIIDSATRRLLLGGVRMTSWTDLLDGRYHDLRLPAQCLIVMSQSDYEGRVTRVEDMGVTDFLYHLRQDNGRTV